MLRKHQLRPLFQKHQWLVNVCGAIFIVLFPVVFLLSAIINAIDEKHHVELWVTGLDALTYKKED